MLAPWLPTKVTTRWTRNARARTNPSTALQYDLYSDGSVCHQNVVGIMWNLSISTALFHTRNHLRFNTSDGKAVKTNDHKWSMYLLVVLSHSEPTWIHLNPISKSYQTAMLCTCEHLPVKGWPGASWTSTESSRILTRCLRNSRQDVFLTRPFPILDKVSVSWRSLNRSAGQLLRRKGKIRFALSRCELFESQPRCSCYLKSSKVYL